MKTRKNMTLRRKLFLLILCSMLALLIGMGSIFVILTGKMQKESQKSLTDFSGEMIESYSEQRETELIENTRTSSELHGAHELAGEHIVLVAAQRERLVGHVRGDARARHAA